MIQLESITRQFKESNQRGFHKPFENDPGSQFLHNCDSIEKDVLANNPQMNKSMTEKDMIELSKQTRLPSPSAAVNEKQKFKVVEYDNKKQQWRPKGGSSVALHFSKRRRVSQVKYKLVSNVCVKSRKWRKKKDD